MKVGRIESDGVAERLETVRLLRCLDLLGDIEKRELSLATKLIAPVDVSDDLVKFSDVALPRL